MRRKTILTSLILLAAVSPAPAEASEPFARLVQTLTQGIPDPVRELRFGITIRNGEGAVAMEQDLVLSLPDKLRNAVRSPQGRQVIVVNGERGAGMTAGRAEATIPERVEHAKQSLGRQLLMLAGNASDPELRVTDRGTETLGDSLCDVVEVVFLGAASTLWIDAEGKALRQRFEGRHFFEGLPGIVEVDYGDYAEMGGYLIPRTRTVRFEGEAVATLTVDALDVNPELGPALFAIGDVR